MYDLKGHGRTFKSGVEFAAANPSCGGPPHSKARCARKKIHYAIGIRQLAVGNS
jgi:hypothetical protein